MIYSRGDSFNWEENPELNITPLVDIMLVLLAILMVTTPTIVYKEDISLAKGSKSSKVLKQSPIEIRIDKKKNIYIKDKTFSYANFADNFILLSNSYSKDVEISIRADKAIIYGDVIFILKSVKEAGFSKVSLITNG